MKTHRQKLQQAVGDAKECVDLFGSLLEQHTPNDSVTAIELIGKLNESGAVLKRARELLHEELSDLADIGELCIAMQMEEGWTKATTPGGPYVPTGKSNELCYMACEAIRAYCEKRDIPCNFDHGGPPERA